MFLHIVAVDRQLSVHAAEKKPLSKAIAEAFKFHKKSLPAGARVETEDGTVLSASKTAKENHLSENDVIFVRDPAQDEPAPKARKSTRKRR